MSIDLTDKRHKNSGGTPVHGTIVFVDIVGSTGKMARLAQQESRDTLDDTRDAIDEAIEPILDRIRQYGGTVARVQGDGVMAIFGAPAPIENHAFNACYAAHKICEDFRALARDAGPEKFTAIRIGIHSGRVLTRVRSNDFGSDYDIIGVDANVAKKVEEQSPPNTALLTGETQQLAGPAVVSRPWGERAIAGKDAMLLELVGISLHHDLNHQFARDHMVPLVGRGDLLARLSSKMGTALHRHGAAFAIAGEAGVGKSRLLFELSKEARALGFRVEELRGHAVHALTPFAPLKPLVLRLLGLEPGAAERTVAPSLAALALTPHLEQGALELAGFRSPSAEWGGLDAGARRRSMIDAATALFANALRERPFLLIADDAHEFDAETQDVVAALKRLTAEAPLVIVATARGTAREAVDRIADEIVELSPLTPEESWQLALSLASGERVSREDLSRTIENAAGNPLFLQGAVRDLCNGRVSGAPPANVTSLVQARMSRMSAPARDVLWAASILRGNFDRPLLGSTVGIDDVALEPLLAELERQHLIDASDPVRLHFHHELFRAAADDLLLRQPRIDLHKRALQALELLAQNPERLEQLAFHAEMAGETTTALNYLLEACRLAVRSSSLKTVRALYAWAMRLKATANADALPVLAGIAMVGLDALQQSGDREEYRKALEFLIGRAQSTGNRADEGLSRAHLALLLWMQAKHHEGRAHAEIALKIAHELDSLHLQALAQPHLANIEHALGNLDRAIDLHLEIVAALEGENFEVSTLGRMIVPSVRSRAFAGWFLAERGRFAEAQAQIDRAEAILAQMPQPYSRVLLNSAIGVLALRSARPADAIAPLEHARELCLAQQFYAMEPCVSGWLAEALVQVGEAERARKVAEHSVDERIFQHGGRYSWVYIHQGLALALNACGAPDKALEAIDLALAFAEESGEPIHVAQTRFARGRVLTAQGDRINGRADMKAALSLAEAHGLAPLAGECRRALT